MPKRPPADKVCISCGGKLGAKSYYGACDDCMEWLAKAVKFAGPGPAPPRQPPRVHRTAEFDGHVLRKQL